MTAADEHRRKTPAKVVFLGTPFVVLPVVEALWQAHEKGILELVLIVSQQPARRGRGGKAEDTPSPIHSWALAHGMPVLTPRRVQDEEFLRTLADLKPDVCVTAAYGQYLPQRFLDIPKFGTINLHPSLLPQYRGAAPVQRALMDGQKITGISLLFSVAKMDAGPLLYQAQERIRDEDNAETLLLRLFLLGAQKLVQLLGELMETGKDAFETVEQDDEQATYAPKITVEDGLIDPKCMSSDEIVHRIRALSLWPGVKVNLIVDQEPVLVRIFTATALSQDNPKFIGKLKLTKDALHLPCRRAESELMITELQIPGKKRLPVSEIVNGWNQKNIDLRAETDYNL